MGRNITLEELEAYAQEKHHAQREDRVPRYRDPREVFNEDPNREEGFLVELTEDELRELEDERLRKLEEQDQIKEQVITELMENGNVVHTDNVLPIQATEDEKVINDHSLTREQAEALYDASTVTQPADSVSGGTLNNPAVAPSVAPEESVVPTPGSITGAPEPMQSIVEAASIQANATGSPHQNLVSTPNPEVLSTDATEEDNAAPVDSANPANPDGTVTDSSVPANAVTPATGGNNPVEPDLGEVHLPTELKEGEPTSVPSPVTDETSAAQPGEQQPPTPILQNIDDPGTQQFQPVEGQNAGPTVPGAETIQTPTLNDEATVPSEPTSGLDITAAVTSPNQNADGNSVESSSTDSVSQGPPATETQQETTTSE